MSNSIFDLTRMPVTGAAKLSDRITPMSQEEFEAKFPDREFMVKIATPRPEMANPADAPSRPDAVWGNIVSNGKVIGKIYDTGGYAYYGNGRPNIDTNISAAETAKQFINLFGGRLERVERGTMAMYL